MTPLTVVLADDNFLVREGVRRLLADGDDVRVVAEAVTGPQLVALATAHRPDAVLTDIRMPPTLGTEGIDAALAIRAALPKTGVVVLSQHADAAYARMLFRNGTASLAYLLKERVADRDELVRALTAVATGGSVVDAQVVDALMSSGRRSEASPLHSLTPRELEVLREMAQGRTNAAIARTLFVSESAVSKHITAIFGKLGLAEDQLVDRRVRAVLTYVTAAGR
ncbi:LuxR C-terminal-related transcriptional regulator [uncultured Amnibacterium sp.]|uniref:LuxR C-terminal-related transcriptional regulator n=1 Tax=uncultured Amnibacterium sp. TaxID=1631851 RepID=UPI0035CC952E